MQLKNSSHVGWVEERNPTTFCQDETRYSLTMRYTDYFHDVLGFVPQPNLQKIDAARSSQALDELLNLGKLTPYEIAKLNQPESLRMMKQKWLLKLFFMKKGDEW